MNLREQLMKECKEYKTNFEHVDDLYRMEHNYLTAKENGEYDFEGCPQNFNCLQLSKECTEYENDPDCKACWKHALHEN